VAEHGAERGDHVVERVDVVVVENDLRIPAETVPESVVGTDRGRRLFARWCYRRHGFFSSISK
jgi:hypothetical protein